MNYLQRLEHRGREAVADCLIRDLTVPNIYFDAEWPNSPLQADVLAIDRAGTGDVHLVEIKKPVFNLPKAIEQVMNFPAQFRWLAYLHLGTTSTSTRFGKLAPPTLYPTQGMGRVGLIEIVRMEGDEVGANIRFRAERFPGNLTDAVDRFVATHKPDVEFR